MKARHIVTWIFVAYMAIFNQAHAVVLGGDEYGWTIDFDRVTPEQKKAFDWSSNKLQIGGYSRLTKTYSTSVLFKNRKEWKLSVQVLAIQKSGPAFVWIAELLEDTKVEDYKNSHYLWMAQNKWFEEQTCQRDVPESAIQTCGVALYNFNPPEVFYSTFYEWEVSGRKFALIVRNAQSTPDKETPVKAIQALVPLITLTTPK